MPGWSETRSTAPRAKRGSRKAELERLFREGRGRVKLIDIVDEAADPDSPLHDYFEWDNEVCGEEYRLEQARTLLRHTFTTIRIDGSGVAQRFRFAVSVPHAEGRVFERTIDVMANPTKREGLLAQARRDFIALREKYAALEELGELFDMIDRL